MLPLLSIKPVPAVVANRPQVLLLDFVGHLESESGAQCLETHELFLASEELLLVQSDHHCCLVERGEGVQLGVAESGLADELANTGFLAAPPGHHQEHVEEAVLVFGEELGEVQHLQYLTLDFDSPLVRKQWVDGVQQVDQRSRVDLVVLGRNQDRSNQVVLQQLGWLERTEGRLPRCFVARVKMMLLATHCAVYFHFFFALFSLLLVFQTKIVEHLHIGNSHRVEQVAGREDCARALVLAQHFVDDVDHVGELVVASRPLLGQTLCSQGSRSLRLRGQAM